MQDIHPQTQQSHPVLLIASHAASAMVIGLCAALPATGTAFLIALTASCISPHGCETPTVVDALVPVVAVTVWTATTLAAGARHLRTVRAAGHHHAPKGLRP